MSDRTSKEPVIRVNDVTKSYRLYKRQRDRLWESLGLDFRKNYKEKHALNGVSFEVGKGETVGIIGTNGSGKSTMLKLITGVLTPTRGNIEVSGRISALLELGAIISDELLAGSSEELDSMPEPLSHEQPD